MAYLTLKRTFEGSCKAKTMGNITKEMMAKAAIYNMLINMRDIERGRPQRRRQDKKWFEDLD
jgi:hypothetical protein